MARQTRIKVPNAMRKQVLSAWYEKEAGCCEICGQEDGGNGKGGSALQAGHKLSYFNGGENSLDNLFPVCPVCNNLQQETTASPEDMTPLKEGMSIKERRVLWVKVLSELREAEETELVNKAVKWIKAGKRSSTVLARLEKEVSETRASELLRLAS